MNSNPPPAYREEQLATLAMRRRSRWRSWVRILVGCTIVIVSIAAIVATGVLLEVKSFTDALKQTPRLKLGNELATTHAGSPETLLLIGSDKRARGALDAGGPPRSDTMLLVRLDPNQPDTTMLSVPRDLEVTIHPDHGQATTQKINAAYSIGGAKLAVKTIKRVLGVQINHVVDINFAGFKALVDYLGCIFIQVDRRDFNDNNPPVGGGSPYATINVEPGYQRLCGSDALDYVRFRHLDTDLVRSARQQDFLRQIKHQIGAGGLVSRRYGIENVFGKYASTDIRTADDVLKLLELLVQSASHPVRQVVFKATLGPSYVTASAAQLQQTLRAFLSPGSAPARVGVPSEPRRRRRASTASDPLTSATADELAQARSLTAKAGFRVFYPVNRVTSAISEPDGMRAYRLHGNRAYVVVVAEGGLGQYYDLEGTTWASPPILNNPNQTIALGARKMQLYFEGRRLRVVGWRYGRGFYWLTNTLENSLTNGQMLAIAQAARPVS